MLVDVLDHPCGRFLPAAIDLAQPDRARFLATDLDPSPTGMRTNCREMFLLSRTGGRVSIDLASNAVMSHHLGLEVNWQLPGPAGYVLGHTNAALPSNEALVVPPFDQPGEVDRQSLKSDVHHFLGFSPDSRFVYQSATAGSLFCSTDPLEVLGCLEGDGSLPGIDFSPDSASVAAASKARGLRVYSLPDLMEQARFKLPPGRMYELDWPAPGDRIAVSLTGGAVVLDSATGETLASVGYPWADYHTGHRIDRSPDGRLLSLFAADQFRPWVVDVQATADVAAISVPLWDWTYFVTVFPGGDLVARLTPNDPDNSVHDAWTGERLAEFESREANQRNGMGAWFSFSTDGRSLVPTRVAANGAVVRSVELATDLATDSEPRPEEELWLVPSRLPGDFAHAVGSSTPEMHPRIDFVADPDLLVAGTPGMVSATGIAALTTFPKSAFNRRTNYERCGVYGVEVAHDGGWVALGTDDKILFYEGVSRRRLRGSPLRRRLSSMLSPGGALLVAGLRSGNIVPLRDPFLESGPHHPGPRRLRL